MPCDLPLHVCVFSARSVCGLFTLSATLPANVADFAGGACDGGDCVGSGGWGGNGVVTKEVVVAVGRALGL